MPRLALRASTALFLVLSTGSAMADVTPEEVWANWQAASTAYGQQMTATSVARSGDTLVVEGLTIRMDDPSGMVVNGTLAKVNFRDKGDGTVEVTMSDSYPLTMSVPDPDEGKVDLALEISQPGLVVTASGTAAETAYDFDAPSVGIRLAKIEGVDAEAVDLTADVTVTAMKGRYLVAGPDTAKTLDSQFSAQSLAMVIVGKDDDSTDGGRITATLANLQGASKGTFAGLDQIANLSAALKAGFAAEGSLSYGATAMDMDITDDGKPVKIKAAASGGSFDFGLDAGRMAYGAGGTGVEVTMSGADIPFPELRIAYDEAAFRFQVPTQPADQPGDFGFLVKIVGLAVSDELWAMADPMGQLPHDPATLVIDTKGKARLTADIFDPAVAAGLGDAPPGELHALEVTDLRASLAGADLTGGGSFTFDNADLMTYAGFPAPTGKLELKLVGGNGLLDKLIAMGLVAEDEAMGFRMMLSMFANPGAGPDELTSTIEFKDKGFFANGQRLK